MVGCTEAREVSKRVSEIPSENTREQGEGVESETAGEAKVEMGGKRRERKEGGSERRSRGT